MTHTPAPWKVQLQPYSSAPRIVSETRQIAKILFDLGSEDAEVMPNARLIAAAPELLDALIQLVEDVEFAQPKIELGLIGNRQIRAARIAIAKAEGK